MNPPSDSPESSFADLGIRPELLATLTALGYEEPTPIQSAAIPMLIEGKDLLGQAATGTGKTASFALPILEKLTGGDRGKAPTSLVLVPTRELALQVSQAFHEYGRAIGTRLVAIYGGAPARQQIDALRRGVAGREAQAVPRPCAARREDRIRGVGAEPVPYAADRASDARRTRRLGARSEERRVGKECRL